MLRMKTIERDHQEPSSSWNIPGLDTVAASRASVWSVYSLLPFGNGGILTGTESGDLNNRRSNISPSSEQLLKKRDANVHQVKQFHNHHILVRYRVSSNDDRQACHQAS